MCPIKCVHAGILVTFLSQLSKWKIPINVAVDVSAYLLISQLVFVTGSFFFFMPTYPIPYCRATKIKLEWPWQLKLL